jgi:L-cysteate sulfo-lyase
MNSGNIFLDKLFGADIKLCPRSENILEYSSKVIENLKSKGTNVYFIPGGGSNSIGALGYVECLNEIIRENNKYNFSQKGTYRKYDRSHKAISKKRGNIIRPSLFR